MSEMDLRQLEVFLSVAQHLHFGRAADELYLSQPTVSQSVSRLERSLGGLLFRRSTRKVELTELGELFVDEARTALAAVEAAYDRGRQFASRGPRQLWVGCALSASPDVVGSVPLLRERCPDIDCEVKEMRTSEQIAALLDGTIDLGVGWLPPSVPGISMLSVGTPTHLVAAMAADHRFADRSSLTLDELAAETLVVHSRDANPALHDLITGWLAANDRGRGVTDVTRGQLALALRVLKGDVIGLAYQLIFRNFPVTGLALVPIEGAPPLQRTIMWRANDPNPAVADLIDVIRALDREAASGSSARALAK